MLTSLIYAEDYPKKVILSNGDTIVAFTPLQAKEYRLLLLDIDDCKSNLEDANRIIVLQDSSLQSKKQLIGLFEKQSEYNEELKYQLTAAVNTQIQRFNVLESAYKSEQKQQKKKKAIIGSAMGIGLCLSIGVLVFQIIK
jgi:hypothetical protein